MEQGNVSEKIAFLGCGIMGAPMARRLLEAGYDLRVWNRDSEKSIPLEEAGARRCDTVAEALAGASLLLTMLSDGPATRAVLAEGALLSELENGALWLQMATVGIPETTRLIELSRAKGCAFVDAPVLGSRQPAEQGSLIVLASGDEAVKARSQAIFDCVGAKTHWLGAAGQSSRMKLLVNNWILGLLGSLAETLSFSRALQLPPEQLLEIIAGGPLDNAFVQSKGKSMLEGEYHPSFPLRHAHKDAALIDEAARSASLSLDITRAVRAHLEHAEQEGHGDQDMAALFEAIRRAR